MSTTAATIATVNDIKAALSKELPLEEEEDSSVERCQDMLKRLDECSMNLKVLTGTLIGTVVSKFKAHATLGPSAKGLVKKWKKQAREEAANPAAKKPRRESSTADMPLAPEWESLPPLRQNIAKKLQSLLELSKKEMLKAGVNREAFQNMSVACATEIEQAIDKKHNDRTAYSAKARSLCFNLKKNSQLRSNLLMGSTAADELVTMSSEELATSETKEARNVEINKLRDSRLLDWDTKNENKINDMCGIKGDLLQASLFTCGRCKSVKTTSTQKQTRSADEPMTVFVLCLNCGKRWKC
jgi:transcription elongation factor S-II